MTLTLDLWPSTHNIFYKIIRWHIYVKISIFGSLETEISQIESFYFMPNAWKPMGILQFCDIFKEGLFTVFAGTQPFLWISKWGLAQFWPTQWSVWRTSHFSSSPPQFWVLSSTKVYTFLWGRLYMRHLVIFNMTQPLWSCNALFVSVWQIQLPVHRYQFDRSKF